MLSKRCVSTTHHGVLIYTPQKHTLSCVILRTKGVFGEHTMVCSGNTLAFTVYDLHYGLHLLNCTFTVSVVETEKASYIYDDQRF